MDPTQKNGFKDANPAGGMGGVPGGSVLGEQAVVPGVQPVVSDTQYVMSGAQPMMPGGQPMGVGSQAMVAGSQSVIPEVQPVMTGAQPMMTDGQAMNATPMNLGIPLSSGDGDIVLNGGAKKKSKKWWIAGGAGVSVITIVVVCLFLIGQKPSSSGTTGYQELFNKYANYYFLGIDNEESSEWLEHDYDASEIFFTNTIDGIGDERGLVLNKMIEYYGAFLQAYDDKKENNPYIEKEIKEYEEKLGLVIIYSTDGLPIMNDISEAYISGGRDKTLSYIDDKSNVYESLDDIYQISFFDLAAKLGYARLELVELYGQFGCLSDGAIDYKCVALIEDDRKSMITHQIWDLLYKIDAIVKSCMVDLTNEIYTIDYNLRSIQLNDDVEEKNDEK